MFPSVQYILDFDCTSSQWGEYPGPVWKLKLPNLYDLTSSAANTKQCQDRNAMIQFSVFDKDIITADDFGGETYFPLSAVPGIPPLW